MPNASREEAAIYAIGAAAQLAGLSPHTVRTWERRYAAVEPGRTRGGGRRYTDTDVERLQLLRVLTTRGAAIGEIAALSTEDLRDRAARMVGGRVHQAIPFRVAVLHPSLATRLDARPAGWDLVASVDDLEALFDLRNEDDLDALMMDLGLLGDDPEGAIERCRERIGVHHVVVLYHFAPRRVLSDLANAGARLVREPVDVAGLHRMLRGQIVAAPPVRPSRPPFAAAPRRFDDQELARLREVATTVDCECPNHLASIVTSLVAFEQYSQRCEDGSPADRALHERLYRQTVQARATIEHLLSEVCEHDGIAI